MKRLSGIYRFALLMILTGGLLACGSNTSNDGGGSSSQSSASSSTSSNASSSSSTTSSSSSSSSTSGTGGNSSSGCPVSEADDPISNDYYGSTSSSSSSSGNASIALTQFCDSSVGTQYATHFEVENSEDGRVDFPEVAGADRSLLAEGFAYLEYANPNNNPVQMKLWLDSPLKPVDLELPPTDGWESLQIDLQHAHQFSITATGNTGSVSFREVLYEWRTAWGFDGVLEIGECPTEPLPGVGDPTPRAPTARVRVKANECSAWGTSIASGTVGTEILFDGSDSTDPNIEPLNYLWDFQDGNTAPGKQVFHAYTDPGIYYVPLTVTDAAGMSDREVVKIRIPGSDPTNRPPVAVITSNRTNLLEPFTTTTVWGDVSYDEDGDPIDHVWYDSFTEEVVRGDEFNIDLTDHPQDLQHIELAVSDRRGGFDTDVITILKRQYPGEDCEIKYSGIQPEFKMEVTLYNNTPSPIQDWQAAWHTDAAVTDLSMTSWSPATLSVTGNHSFSAQGDVIPAYSWVTVYISGQSSATLENINFALQNDITCIEKMPAR